MPLDVLGGTRATMVISTSIEPLLRSKGNLLKGNRDGNRRLELSFVNEEFLVRAIH